MPRFGDRARWGRPSPGHVWALLSHVRVILVTSGAETRKASEMAKANDLLIDCDQCVMQHTSACDDCMVSFIVGREPGEAVVFDVAEARALRALSSAGLVPELRHRARVADAG